MSTTVQGVDARTYLAGWAMALKDMYSKDIAAIPEDKWTATFGGVSRSAGDATADASANLTWITGVLTGQDTGDYGALMGSFKDTCSTKAGATDALGKAISDFASALKSAPDDKLNENIMAPWGMETPVMTLANIAVSHIWYHDGQLNYIQTLLGDGEVHWM